MEYSALYGKSQKYCIWRSAILCFYQEYFGLSLMLSFVVLSLTFLYGFYREITNVLRYIKKIKTQALLPY